MSLVPVRQSVNCQSVNHLSFCQLVSQPSVWQESVNQSSVSHFVKYQSDVNFLKCRLVNFLKCQLVNCSSVSQSIRRQLVDLLNFMAVKFQSIWQVSVNLSSVSLSNTRMSISQSFKSHKLSSFFFLLKPGTIVVKQVLDQPRFLSFCAVNAIFANTNRENLDHPI